MTAALIAALAAAAGYAGWLRYRVHWLTGQRDTWRDRAHEERAGRASDRLSLAGKRRLAQVGVQVAIGPKTLLDNTIGMGQGTTIGVPLAAVEAAAQQWREKCPNSTMWTMDVEIRATP